MNTTFNFWVNNRANARGSYDIYIRITQARRHKLIKTGVTIKSRDEFNKNAKQENWIRGRGESTKKVNDTLSLRLATLKGEMEELNKRVKNPSKESIIQKYRGESSHDFMVYLKLIIKRFEDRGAYRTAKRYGQLKNKLEAFESDSIPFDSITVTFLEDFETYLTNLHINTRYEHFKNMRSIFNKAIKEDIISNVQNPFAAHKVNSVPTKKEKLSIAEINKLKKLKLPKNSSLSHTRNCFMFSFYCGGIRAGDLIMMRWNNIKKNKLTYVMSKGRNKKLTDREIPILSEANKILKQYQTKDIKQEDFIFRELDNNLSKYISEEKKIKPEYVKKIYNRVASRNTILNKNLKKLAEMSGITKPITFHIARHSFAQYSISKGMTPKELQSILRHEKFATTEIYLEELDDKNIETAMKKVFK